MSEGRTNEKKSSLNQSITMKSNNRQIKKKNTQKQYTPLYFGIDFIAFGKKFCNTKIETRHQCLNINYVSV